MPQSAHDSPTDFAFRNGELILTRGQVEIRVVGWPDPRAAWRRQSGDELKPYNPDFRLVHPYRRRARQRGGQAKSVGQLCFDFHEQLYSPAPPEQLSPNRRRERAFDQFRFSLPKPVAKVIEPFQTNQWPLLVMLYHDPGALELANSNPALAFFLAQRFNGDVEMIASLKCSSMRQRDLLELLDFENSKRAAKCLSKVDPASLSGDNWDAVLNVLARQLRLPKSVLTHLPSINAGVISVLENPLVKQHASVPLLTEISETPSERYRARVAHLISSTLEMQDGLSGAIEVPEQFTSVERLEEIHNEVAEHYRRRLKQLAEASQSESEQFRNPPIPGIPGKIEPITSARALVDEGEAQHNCVASYAKYVREGSRFIYRVLEPERATLSIERRNREASWFVSELEARYNTPVAEETEDFVAAWLDRNLAFI
ncbi:MAG: PcfJ domain-containing protein [Verrucomicrobiota bacterium]